MEFNDGAREDFFELATDRTEQIINPELTVTDNRNPVVPPAIAPPLDGARDRQLFSLSDFYEIEDVSKKIVSGWEKGRTKRLSLLKRGNSQARQSAISLLKVALQLPDYLLKDAATVCWEMESAIRNTPYFQSFALNNTGEGEGEVEMIEDDVLCFILGDTSYGSCCVDEVAAEHLSADVVIHYGRSCLSSTKRIPVIYVFGKLVFDVDDAVTTITTSPTVKESLDTRKFLVLYDVMYNYKTGHFQKELAKGLKIEMGDVIVGSLDVDSDFVLGGSTTIVYMMKDVVMVVATVAILAKKMVKKVVAAEIKRMRGVVVVVKRRLGRNYRFLLHQQLLPTRKKLPQLFHLKPTILHPPPLKLVVY